MVTRPESRTTTLALALLAGSLLACKMFKKGEEEALPEVPSAVVPPAASEADAPPQPEAPAPTTALKLGDVKRFADKEKQAEGVVKVLEADAKVFNEPDVNAQHVAELNKDIFVSRLATLDDFVLVEFPSGVGELSPGWVQAKVLSDPDTKVTEEKVKEQQAAAKIVADKKDDATDKKETAKADDKADDKADTKETVKDDKTDDKVDTKETAKDDKADDETKEAPKDDTGGNTSTTGETKVKRKKKG